MMPSTTSCIAASADLDVANGSDVADTGRPFTFHSPAISADEHDTVQNDGCTVDGRLAVADAGHGGCRARDHARAERLPDHGSALGDRVHAPPPDHLPRRWLQGGRDQAPAAAPRAQWGPLLCPARLVL